MSEVKSENEKTGIPDGGKRQRGRPSDREIDRASIQAAYEEFVRKGYHGLSMEAIASRAGVSKVSLYRRWANKAEIIAEVFRMMGEQSGVPYGGRFEDQVRSLIRNALVGEDAGNQGQLVMRIIGEIASNPELVSLYRDLILYPRLKQVNDMLENARKNGELGESVSVEAAGALIGGPLLMAYLALLAGMDVDLSIKMADELTDMVLAGLGK